MNPSRFTVAIRIGAVAAFVHLMAFIVTLLQIDRSSAAQASLVWLKWWWLVSDFPFTLLYLISGETYSSWLAPLQNSALGQLLYLPHLIHGILGTIWWFFLPRMFLPKKRGGVWFRHDDVSSTGLSA